MRGIGIGATALSVIGLAVALLMSRKETRVRIGFDGVRLALTIAGIATMAAVTSVSTPVGFIGLALLAGSAVGWAQGRALRVRVLDGRLMARRSAIGIALFGAGMLGMQVSGLLARVAEFRVGQGISYFSAAMAAGLIIGRDPRVREARVASGAAIVAVLAVVLASAAFGTFVFGSLGASAYWPCPGETEMYVGGKCVDANSGPPAEDEERGSQPPPPAQQEDVPSDGGTSSDGAGAGTTYSCPEGQVMRYENGDYWCYEYVTPDEPPEQQEADTQSGREHVGSQLPACAVETDWGWFDAEGEFHECPDDLTDDFDDDISNIGDDTDTSGDRSTTDDISPMYDTPSTIDYGSPDSEDIDPDEALAATITGLIIMAGLGLISVAEAGDAIGQLLGRDGLGKRLLGGSRSGGSTAGAEPPQADSAPSGDEDLLPPDPSRTRSPIERFEETMKQAGDALVQAMTKDPETFNRVGGRIYEPLDRIRNRVDARGGWVTEDDIARAKALRDRARAQAGEIVERERVRDELVDAAATAIEGGYVLAKGGATVIATGGGAPAVAVVQGSAEFFESIGKGKGLGTSFARGVVSGGFGGASAMTSGGTGAGQKAIEFAKEVSSQSGESMTNEMVESIIETGELPSAQEAADAAAEGAKDGAKTFVGQEVAGKVLEGSRGSGAPAPAVPKAGSASEFDVARRIRGADGVPRAGSASEFDVARSRGPLSSDTPTMDHGLPRPPAGPSAPPTGDRVGSDAPAPATGGWSRVSPEPTGAGPNGAKDERTPDAFDQARSGRPTQGREDADVGGTDPRDYGRTMRTRFGDLTIEPGARRPEDPPDQGGGRKPPGRSRQGE